MVDCASYLKMNELASKIPLSERGMDSTEIKKRGHLCLCAPTVCGYSFVRKEWGRFAVDGFSEIQWNESAFRDVLLPPDLKSFVKSLVNVDRGSNTKLIRDLISGKGGGCCILLYGRPGTGKTLTAEAIAEETRRPLIVITAGELGIDVTKVQNKLTKIFEISKVWDALLLLDEADVLLERRSSNEILRNALVGTFLRAVEYQEQVMFLTTNRLEQLDEALRSRISVAIQYHDLDTEARKRLWSQFLRMAKVNIVDNLVNEDEYGTSVMTTENIEFLASKDLNGR